MEASFYRRMGFAVLVACFKILSFVVLLLASPSSNAHFYISTFGEDFERHNGLALLFGSDELVDLFSFRQEFATASLGIFGNTNTGST